MLRPNFRFVAFGIIAGSALLAACDADRAISSQQAGAVAYGSQFALNATGTPAFNFPRGTVRFRQSAADSAITDTIQVTLSGLDTLEAGVYTIWAGNRAGTNWKRLTGDLRVIQFDTTINALGDPQQKPDTFPKAGNTAGYVNQAAFSRGGANRQVRFTTTRTQSGLTATDTVHVVLVTIESPNTAPTTPSTTRRPLWARRGTTTAGQSVTRTMSFGFYRIVTVNNALVDSSYIYVPNGRGRVLIRGTTIVVTDSGLGTPPMGYYYAAWAVREDTFYVTQPKATGTGVDTVAKLAPDTVYLGAQTTPLDRDPKSLFNADMEVIDPNVQLTTQRSILSAANRFEFRTAEGYGSIEKPLRGFQWINITLEAKDADQPGGTSENQRRMGPAILLQAPVPTVLYNGRAG
jgi:hypothetical protein